MKVTTVAAAAFAAATTVLSIAGNAPQSVSERAVVPLTAPEAVTAAAATSPDRKTSVGRAASPSARPTPMSELYSTGRKAARP